MFANLDLKTSRHEVHMLKWSQLVQAFAFFADECKNLSEQKSISVEPILVMGSNLDMPMWLHCLLGYAIDGRDRLRSCQELFK